MNVSRTPVRQALFRLHQEGFVEVLFKSGWPVMPFDFDQFELLYDPRQVLETTAVHRLCDGAPKINQLQIDALADIWFVGTADCSLDAKQVAQ